MLSDLVAHVSDWRNLLSDWVALHRRGIEVPSGLQGVPWLDYLSVDIFLDVEVSPHRDSTSSEAVLGHCIHSGYPLDSIAVSVVHDEDYQTSILKGLTDVPVVGWAFVEVKRLLLLQFDELAEISSCLDVVDTRDDLTILILLVELVSTHFHEEVPPKDCGEARAGSRHSHAVLLEQEVPHVFVFELSKLKGTTGVAYEVIAFDEVNLVRGTQLLHSQCSHKELVEDSGGDSIGDVAQQQGYNDCISLTGVTGFKELVDPLDYLPQAKTADAMPNDVPRGLHNKI